MSELCSGSQCYAPESIVGLLRQLSTHKSNPTGLLSPALFCKSHYGLSIAAGTMQHWWRLEGFVGCDLLISALTRNTHARTHTQIYSLSHCRM